MTYAVLCPGQGAQHPGMLDLFVKSDAARETLDAARHVFDPADQHEADAYSLVFNRMSPSAYLRGV